MAIWNQNDYHIKEICQDFYVLIADTFADKGYRYRKSKHDICKTIGSFKIHLDFQTFSSNCLGDEIEVRIDKTISFHGHDKRDCFINIGELDNTENAVTGTFDIKSITQDRLDELVSAIHEYIDYMELLVEKFTQVHEIDVKSLKLVDPYGEAAYESNGVDYDDRYYGKEKGLTHQACHADGSLDLRLYAALLRPLKKRKWYEYYTEESIQRVYRSFYRFLKETHTAFD